MSFGETKELQNDYRALNAMLNLTDADGKIRLDKDKEAVKQYFLEHVNKNTMFFHDLREKLDYLIKNGYYESDILDNYSFKFVKSLFRRAYSYKFRFPSYVSALKFYNGYALQTNDKTRYLERYEDRVCMNALYLARGNEAQAIALVDELVSGRYQPATPTYLNAGRAQRGELVSCFLMRTEDNMESIGRIINGSLQLSKRGGGVALCLTNLREAGSPIKGIQNASSGVVPVMKLLEDSFSYANQLGARQGAGAVYIHAHHPDIMKALDTKRENADEKIRIKTLSIGIVVPDITFELAKKNEDMYMFSPYDVQRVYGKPMTEISVTEKYYEMVDDPRIKKTKMNARKFFMTVAELQFESGYPYLMFEDTVNAANPIDGRISMSNLCSEILQVSEPSEYNEDLSYSKVGKDISCNLGSMNIAKVMESGDIGKTVNVAVRALTSVSDLSNIQSVPSIERGNKESHAIGLGQMNMHGFLMKVGIPYDSPEAVDFTDIYFYTVTYHAIKTSMEIATERKETFKGFEKSKYATGEYFRPFIRNGDNVPKTVRVAELFADIDIPTAKDWEALAELVKINGMYNQNLQAVPPTGSISYVNNSTSSIHPATSRIEIRKEGSLGRVYYPAPYLTNDNAADYKDAYEIGYKAIIDVYAAATKYVDQGLSLTLFFTDKHTTRDINQAQVYAWTKGIKTIYYVRLRQAALEGTQVDSCVSCTL